MERHHEQVLNDRHVTSKHPLFFDPSRVDDFFDRDMKGWLISRSVSREHLLEHYAELSAAAKALGIGIEHARTLANTGKLGKKLFDYSKYVNSIPVSFRTWVPIVGVRWYASKRMKGRR